MNLWVESYRPVTLDEYVFKDAAQRQKVEAWLSEGALPHLMLSGTTGTGKTSLAKLLLRLLNVPKGDILTVNASRERKVEDIQDRIIGFVSGWAIGPSGIKYVLLDEADSLSPLAQRILRGEMETYHDTCRFILTCNYPAKIIPAIHGRCQGFHFEALDRDDFTARIGEVLTREGVTFEVDALFDLVHRTYPDLRKCINMAQQASIGGALVLPSATVEGFEWVDEAIRLMRARRTNDARKLIIAEAPADAYDDVWRYLYQSLDLFASDDEGQGDALLLIRDGLVNHSRVADVEINLSATLLQLCRLRP